MKKTLPLKRTFASLLVIAILAAWGYHAYKPPTAVQIVDEMESMAGGAHPGFRRNHAKGLCISGRFDSNGNAAEVSSASVFKPGSVPVLGRLSAAVATRPRPTPTA